MTASTVTETALDRLRRGLEQALNEEYKLEGCKPDEARAIREQRGFFIRQATHQIHIDAEFEALIPALTTGEREQLRKNLKHEGVRDPLVLWLTPDGELVLVDGHNRLSIIEAEALHFDVVIKAFADREQARHWMLYNQLGRRNLTKEQRGYMLGKLVQSEKGQHGGARSKDAAQGRAVERVAEQQGVSVSQAKRAEQFAEAVDRIGESAPEVKQKILSGQAEVTKGELERLAHAPDDVIAEAAELIQAGQPIAPPKAPVEEPLPLQHDEPQDQAKPMAASSEKQDADLSDDTDARYYLEGIAENDPMMFAIAVENVIDAHPPALGTLWSWALAHHHELLSVQDMARLEQLYKQATEPEQFATPAAPSLVPPPELKLCQTHAPAKAHWVVTGEKPAICGGNYVRNWQDVKDPAAVKICADCERLKSAYEQPFEPFILNADVAAAYLARQAPEVMPRAVAEVLKVYLQLSRQAVAQARELLDEEGQAWLDARYPVSSSVA